MLLDKMGFYSRKPIFAQPGLSGAKYGNRKGDVKEAKRLAPMEPQRAIDLCLSCPKSAHACKGSDRCKRLKGAKV